MIYDAYHALANAIVMQAVKDYQTALKYDDTDVKNECERFFRSEWFSFLTDVDGEIIIREVQRRNNTKRTEIYLKSVDR